MKRLLLIVLSVALFSMLHACTDDQGRKGASTKEVVDEYVKTLSEAKGKATDAAKMVEERIKHESDLIDEGDRDAEGDAGEE